MKKNYLLFFLLFATTFFSGFAQTITSQKGLTTAIFNLPAGIIKVYLPDDMMSGETVTGSIVAEAAGKNVKQIEKNITELKKYSIDFNGQKILVLNTLNNFRIKINDGKFLQRPLNLVNSIGANVGQISLPYNQNKLLKPLSAECYIPSHALTAAPLRITGPFDGDASNTKCSLDNKPLEILAESPRQCIIAYPTNAKGIQTLNVQENNQTKCSQQVSAVEMIISAGKLNLQKGQRTYIDVKITGLLHLPDTAILTLNNMTSEVVNMQPSNNIAILIIPDSLSKADYYRRFDIESIITGTFTVNVNLDLPENRYAVNINDLTDLMNESGYPGSYGYIDDKPCEPDGKTVTWRWHKTFICEIDDRKILMCGHTKEGDDVLEKIKEFLKEVEMDKANDISEKMAKAFSTAKTFSYSIHVTRKWVDYDIYYKCINGKWQAYGGVYINIGTDDLGWHNVKHPTTDCWMTFDSPAAKKEFETALENALRTACK